MTSFLNPSRRTLGLIASAGAASLAMPGIARAQTKRTLRLAHHLPTTTEQHLAAENFAKKVAAASNGNITIQILPAGQGGGQREVIESVSLGTLDMGYGESGLYANYIPEFSVLALAYLYRDFDHWKKVVDGEVGLSLATAIEKKSNLKVLNWMVGGYRYSFLRTKPINTPDDFKGMKIRLPEAPVFVKTFAALSAIPTPVPAPEMYAALQTGVVDAMEGTAEVGYTFKIFQVTKFLSKTRHILMDGSFAMNAASLGKMSAEEQAIINKAAAETATEQRAMHFEREKQWMDRLVNEGKITVNEPDLKPFAEKLAPLQNEFAAASKATDLLDKIRKL
jgi:TRAP-type transport system periplasmic protein